MFLTLVGFKGYLKEVENIEERWPLLVSDAWDEKGPEKLAPYIFEWLENMVVSYGMLLGDGRYKCWGSSIVLNFLRVLFFCIYLSSAERGFYSSLTFEWDL